MFAPALADTVSGMDPANFAFLSRVELEHFWFVPRGRLITRLINRHFPQGQALLEIGCGTGTVLSTLAKKRSWTRVVGSELHPAGLRIARNRLGELAELVQMDARAIPAAGVFDVIGAFDVIEHIDDDEAVLSAMYRALRPGGGIAITVPQHPWLWSAVDEMACHVRRYRCGELEAKAKTAGFRILYSASYTSLLLPLMLISRISARCSGSSKGAARATVESEFVVPPIVNRLLRAMLEIEVSLTLSGLRFPFGGSRIVVAKKDEMAA
jgi:SAM-dependent methyltransferase